MENFSKGRDNRPVCSLRRFGGVTNGAKDRCIRCVTLIDYSPPLLPRSTTLDRVGAGFALAGGGERRRGVKTTGKRAPVKSTWPDQSHSSSTRGHHRTSYLKWRTRRISPSLISTRRNFCIDVPPVSVYTGKAARRRRQGNFSDAHPRRGEPTDRVEQRERVFRNRIHIYMYMYVYTVDQGKSRAPVSSTVFRARKYDRPPIQAAMFPTFYRIYTALYKGYGE